MTKLNITPNLSAPDDFYADLIQMHEGLSDDESMALNARLILILANHIGDYEALRSALSLAKKPSHDDDDI